MDDSRMVHMANQIAAFFAPYPHERAVADIADHLAKFWPPPMRAQLAAYLAKGGEGLNARVVEAAARLPVKG